MPKPPIDASQFAPQLLNFALDLSLEWGADWMRAINQRVRAAHPALSEQQAQTLQDWCVEAREFAFAEIAKWYALEVEDKVQRATQTTRQKYPQIDAHNLSRLYNQVVYYAWHG